MTLIKDPSPLNWYLDMDPHSETDGVESMGEGVEEGVQNAFRRA